MSPTTDPSAPEKASRKALLASFVGLGALVVAGLAASRWAAVRPAPEPPGSWRLVVVPEKGPDHTPEVGEEVRFTARLKYEGAGKRPPPPEAVTVRSSQSADPIRLRFESASAEKAFSVRTVVDRPLTVKGLTTVRRTPVALAPASVRARPRDAVLLLATLDPAVARFDGKGWRAQVALRLVEKDPYRRSKQVVYAVLGEDLQVDLTTTAGEIAPKSAVIPSGSSRPAADLEFSTTRPEGNAIEVRGVSAAVEYERRLAVPCDRDLPVFSVSVLPPEVPADGLSSATVLVRLREGELSIGLPLEKASVRLASSLPTEARLEPDVVEFAQGEYEKTATLRSHATGLAKIRATGMPYAVEPAGGLEARFFFPWIALAVALAGGLAGSWLKILYGAYKGGGRKRLRGIPWVRLGLGVGAALFVWLAIRHGFSTSEILGLRVAGALSGSGSFFVGLLAGFFATRVMEWLGSRKPESPAGA